MTQVACTLDNKTRLTVTRPGSKAYDNFRVLKAAFDNGGRSALEKEVQTKGLQGFVSISTPKAP